MTQENIQEKEPPPTNNKTPKDQTNLFHVPLIKGKPEEIIAELEKRKTRPKRFP